MLKCCHNVEVINMKAIRKLRGSIGLSQEDLADKIGVSRNTIAFIESDKCESISPIISTRLCDFFKVREIDLYIEDNLKLHPQTDMDRLNIIMNIFDSAEDKKNLKNLIFQLFEGRNNVN